MRSEVLMSSEVLLSSNYVLLKVEKKKKEKNSPKIYRYQQYHSPQNRISKYILILLFQWKEKTNKWSVLSQESWYAIK